MQRFVEKKGRSSRGGWLKDDPRNPLGKGHKRLGGRKKGTPNKNTVLLKEAIMEAARLCGEDGKGKGELTGYMKRLAMKQPNIFGQLLGKLLPYQLTGKDGAAIAEDVTVQFNGLDITKCTLDDLAGLYRKAIAAPIVIEQEPVSPLN